MASVGGSQYQLQKTSITHDNIIDFVITRPSVTYREIAAAFNYSPEGIGIICRSDAFRARLEVRKEELVDPIIKQTVEDRLVGLAHASMDILQRKLATSDDPKLALAALDAATKAGQYGARSAAVGQGVTFVVQLPGPAANSTEWMSKFGHPAPLIVVEEVKTRAVGVGETNRSAPPLEVVEEMTQGNLF